jgi:hypothetical protein
MGHFSLVTFLIMQKNDRRNCPKKTDRYEKTCWIMIQSDLVHGDKKDTEIQKFFGQNIFDEIDQTNEL